MGFHRSHISGVLDLAHAAASPAAGTRSPVSSPRPFSSREGRAGALRLGLGPWGLIHLIYKLEKTKQVPLLLRTSMSLSDNRLGGNVSRFTSSANVSSRIFAELSQGASGVEVGEEGVGDKQQTLLGRQSSV